MVADDAELERYPGLDRIADGGGHTGIGHRDDGVGIDVALAGKLDADAFADLIDVLSLDTAVGTREIDIFEDAELTGGIGERLDARDPRAGDGDDLSRFDIAHELGADDVKGAGLRRQDVGAIQGPQHQRPDPVRVPDPDQRVVGQRHQRISPVHLLERVDQAVDHGGKSAGRDQVGDDFGIGGRLEQGAALHQFLAQGDGVGEVAVVTDGEAAELEIGEQGLDVALHGLAGGGIAHMADGRGARQLADHLFGAEIVGDEAEAALVVEVLAVEGDYAGGFLSPVLQGVQAERRVGRRVRGPEDAEYAALLA